MRRRDVHERYLYAICELGNKRTFREEAEQLLADCVGKGEDDEAEGGHLRHEEEEGEGVAGSLSVIACVDASAALTIRSSWISESR